MAKLISVVGAGMAFAALAGAGAAFDTGGFSHSKATTARCRDAARKEREGWEAPEGESRQVRRARERREAKRRGLQPATRHPPPSPASRGS